MALSQFWLYDAAGAPLATAVPVFTSYRRRNSDGTYTTLSQPVITNRGGGLYDFVIPDSDLTAGSVVNFLVDGGSSANPRRLSGSVLSTEAGGVVGIPGVEGAEFIITVSEREPVLVYALKQADGTALNLESGSPTVTFSMGPAAGGALKVSAVASEIVDAANGIVRYRWGATDTDTKGDFLGRFNVSENGGLGSAYPLNRTIVVRVIANVT